MTTKPTFPSPSAGSVDGKLREVFGEIIDGAYRAGFRQSMSGHVGGWQRKAAIDGLIRNALTAVPAPVLVIELDQKENSTRMERSESNESVPLSVPQVERATEAAYNKFNENLIGCCEPAWSECAEDFKDRLRGSIAAALTEIETQLREEKSLRLKLQRALMFWMPGVSESVEQETNGRAGRDAMLLYFFEGELETECWGDRMLTKLDAETRRTAPDDGLDQKIAPLTKDNHPEQEVSRLSDPLVTEETKVSDVLAQLLEGVRRYQSAVKIYGEGSHHITFARADSFLLHAKQLATAVLRKLSTDATTDSRDPTLRVEPPSDPSPAVLNEELVRALEDLVEIERRDSLTDPDISATDTWREQAWMNARSILSRSKPSP